MKLRELHDRQRVVPAAHLPPACRRYPPRSGHASVDAENDQLGLSTTKWPWAPHVGGQGHAVTHRNPDIYVVYMLHSAPLRRAENSDKGTLSST
ncbi:hypothetical protein FRACA_1560005 [Frankia canadensis]|uniref:Uncharacterized protein n=1 Tax=Frankia canadensis TaxID=1836972 RepID=A0A2I2KMA4_9ACTN|nr:hypothetical protein FRACA_1560005 [Frankia canadensis]SOU54085.1 hypothetical protein FRACA_1560005 [Frankia canadensis]